MKSRTLHAGIAEKAEYALAILVTSAFFLANLPIAGPVYQADEGGYLANAAAIAGFSVDVASSYYAGYSLLLAPAFSLANSPESVYLVVKLINSLLWGGVALLAFRTLAMAFPTVARGRLLWCLLVALLYPSWIVMSGYAFSSTAVVLTFILSAFWLLRIQSFGGMNWLWFAVAVGYLYSIHPSSAAIVVSSTITLLLLGHVRGEWHWCVAAILLLFGCALAYSLWLAPGLAVTMTTGDYPMESHYPSASKVLSSLITLDGILKLAICTMGQITYLMLSTYGLITIPFIWLLRQRPIFGASLSQPDYLLVFYGTISLLGVTTLSSISMSIGDSMRLDHWMYGRYTEGFTLLLLASALCLWSTRHFAISLIALAVCFTLFYAGLPNKSGGFIALNGLGLWQNFVVDYDPDTTSPGQIIAQWGLMASPILAILLFARPISARLFVLMLAFSATAWAQLQNHFAFSAYFIEPKMMLASKVRQLYPDRDCVVLHQEGWPQGDSWYVYAFYFHDANFSRVRLKNWPSACNGPLLTSWKNIDDLIPSAYPLALGQLHGLMLWADSTRLPKNSPQGQCEPFTCIQYEDLHETYSQVGRRENVPGQSLPLTRTDGRAGYLLYGPYFPLSSGEYILTIQGQVRAAEDKVIIDVVSALGGTTLARYQGLGHYTGADGTIDLKEKVSISQDHDAVEIRILVAEDVDLTINDYSLRAMNP